MNRDGIREAVAAFLPAEALLPEEAFLSWPEDVPPPAAWVAPATEEEMALLLKRASREQWRVLPAGAGEWLQGWGTPEVELVVSTRRLSKMEGYEPADLTFTAGAGIPMAELHEATEANGQWLPLDPPGSREGTLGALVANGVGGPLRQAYGGPRDHILGVTLVSGDGRILRWGGRVVKNVAGFDVTRLSIGSRGALGIITSVSARLFPVPRDDRTLLLQGDSIPGLLRLARSLACSSIPLSALELLAPGVEGEGVGMVVARLLGTRPQLQAMEDRILKEARELAGGKIQRLDGEESRAFHAGMEGWERGAGVVARLALPPSRLGDLLSWGRELGQGVGFQGPGPVKMAAHVGWGVLRVAFPGEAPESQVWEGVARGLRELREKVEGEGGSLSLSQAPARLHGHVRDQGTGDRVTHLIQGLKKTFDPRGILVPGRVKG